MTEGKWGRFRFVTSYLVRPSFKAKKIRGVSWPSWWLHHLEVQDIIIGESYVEVPFWVSAHSAPVASRANALKDQGFSSSKICLFSSLILGEKIQSTVPMILQPACIFCSTKEPLYDQRISAIDHWRCDKAATGCSHLPPLSCMVITLRFLHRLC